MTAIGTVPRCMESGCVAQGRECLLPDGTPYAYCDEHAGLNGFCRLCGQFSAGTESFDFHHPGLCDECDFQMRDACGELDDDDEYDGCHWLPEDDY